MSTLMVKVKKLKGMPLHTVVKKVAGKALQETQFAYRRYRIRFAPISLDPDIFHGFKSKSCFLFDPQKREECTAFLENTGRNLEIIQDADRICEHHFDLLGSGDMYLGESLPWHEDFKSHFRWEPKFFKSIKTVDLNNDADVKVPWELSRFQHLFTLGKAYWLTQDEKYALEFESQLNDWTAQNPPEMSVNWTCTMDVAIRAVNWISAVYFFRESPSIEAAFWDRFHASLYLHGSFIMNNLENTGEHTGNHYLSNLAGLMGLGLYFGSIEAPAKDRRPKVPREWLDFGFREMQREMFIQVNEDGSNYEASTSYHRLVAELFLVSTLWCSRNGIEFPGAYRKRLEKMHDFILGTMKPDGRTPLIGDADDGRLLIVAGYGGWARNDFRHLLAVAGEFFDRDDFRWAGQTQQEDALWIAGSVESQLHTVEVSKASEAFPDGGYYVLRSEEVYCLIRCGELSFHGHGAHSHNDQLSFELQVKGQDLIIDPGAYVYSSDYRMRNLFRSTHMHNTVQVGGLEQNDFDEQNLFLMREQTFAQCEFSGSYFNGSHLGYVKKNGVIHRREFQLRTHELQIVDTLEQSGLVNTGSCTFTASFMLAPGTRVSQKHEELELQVQGMNAVMLLEGAVGIEIQDSWVSPRYGVRTPSQRVCIHSKNSALRTIFRWR